MAVEFSTARTASQAALTLPWAGWDPFPASGDLVIIVSTRPLTGVPSLWTRAGTHSAYATWNPLLPDPVFASEDDGSGWQLHGGIAYREG